MAAAERLRKCKEEHAHEIENIKEEYAAKLESLDDDHRRNLDEMRRKHRWRVSCATRITFFNVSRAASKLEISRPRLANRQQAPTCITSPLSVDLHTASQRSKRPPPQQLHLRLPRFRYAPNCFYCARNCFAHAYYSCVSAMSKSASTLSSASSSTCKYRHPRKQCRISR